MKTNIGIVLASLAVVGCSMNVDNPSIIDASKYNPNTNGTALALSAQSVLYIAFQDVSIYSGEVSEENWTGAIRLQTIRLASRNFVGSDDIDTIYFAPISSALTANTNAVAALKTTADAATNINLARVQMNAGWSFLFMADVMCQSDVHAGPAITDAQLLDSAVTWFKAAVAVGTANGTPDGAAIVSQSQVGLARAYLQLLDYSDAEAQAALVPAGFVANVVTTANQSTQLTLGNQIYGTTVLGQLLAPQLYRHLNDPRVPTDSGLPYQITNGLPVFVQTKYTGYADPIRLASGLEAQFINAEAQLHGSSNTGPALAIIASERAVGGQGSYSGATDTLSVLAELLNQRAREFWMEGKKLGDLRRNPSVPVTAVLTDPQGAAFYANGEAAFGNTYCAPIPPAEVNSNPNLH